MVELTTTLASSYQLERMTVSFYERDVPAYIADELDRLYGNLYCSLAFFKACTTFKDIYTYVVRRDGEIITIFLFECNGKRILVLNQLFKTNEEEINCFAMHAFSRFKTVSIISFISVHATLARLSFYCQKINCKEDFVISLPGDPQKFLSTLGKSTRDNLKLYRNRLQKAFGNVRYRFYVNTEVHEHHILDVISLHKIRMQAKNGQFSEEMARHCISLAKECQTLVCLMSVNDCLVAGSISYRFGANYYLYTLGHDPQYDYYRVGLLCACQTICESIGHGGKEYHLGWGRHDYKSRFAAVQQDMDQLEIYRSPLQAALHGNHVAKNIFNGYLRQLKLWIRNPKHRHRFISRFAVKGHYFLQKLKGNG